MAGLVVLAPWLWPGELLVRDLVAVGDPAWSTALLTGGSRLARDVPGEVLAALLGQVLGGGVVARGALVLACVALGAGVGRLLAGAHPAVVAVGAVAAVHNPWTWAHLRAGQWLVVVALATVPWVAVHVAADDRWGTARATASAAVTGFLATVVVWPTLVVVGLWTRRWKALAVGIATAAVTALPWAVLGGPGRVDPDGFAAFAVRADTPLGTWGSIVSGGGYFNATIASPWRETVLLGGLATLLAVVALVLAACHAREVAGTPRGGALIGLGTTAGVAVLVAGVGATAAGQQVLVAASRAVPALAAVRDTHRLLAPLVVVLAVGVAVGVARLGRVLGPVAVAVAAVGMLVLALPDPVVGPRLPGPVEVPAAWRQAAARVDADPRPGVVLAVPPGQTQRYAFTDGRPVAVPLRRLAAREVVGATSLRVGDLVVDDGVASPPWAGLAESPPRRWDPERFAASGVAWVAVTDPGRLPERGELPGGFTPVVDAPSLVLLRVEGDPPPGEDAHAPAWLVVLDVALLVAVTGLWGSAAGPRPAPPHEPIPEGEDPPRGRGTG